MHVASLVSLPSRNHEEEDRKIEALIKVGLHGHYCGAESISFVANLYDDLAPNHHHLDLQGQIFLELMKLRRAIFERIFSAEKNSPEYAFFLSFFSPILRLEFAGIVRERPPLFSPIIERMVSFYEHIFIQPFNEGYQEIVVEFVKLTIDDRKNPQINHDQLKNWFVSQNISTDDAFDENGLIRFSAVKLLLLGMGICSLDSLDSKPSDTALESLD